MKQTKSLGHCVFSLCLGFCLLVSLQSHAGLFSRRDGETAGQPAEVSPLPTTGPYSFSETFAGPPAEASLRTHWQCGFGWEWKDDALRHQLGGKQFAVLNTSPFGETVDVAATVTVSGATGTGWKIGGISVYWDKKNYWHLAFVQSPVEDGAKHFIELSEMYDGTWLSHNKLKSLSLAALPEFVWELDHPYRFRIVLGDGKIVGTVSELDGTLRWHKGFEFNAPAVTKGRPAVDNGGLFTAFRDFETTVDDVIPPPIEEQITFAPYSVSSSTLIRGKKTGFFHTEKKHGKWWIIDPNGDAFWAVATDHCKYRGHWCQALGYAPHHRKMIAKYGSEEAWADASTERLKKWGFNTLGAGCDKSTYEKGLSHTAFTSLGGHFCHFGADFRISYPENEKPTPCSYFPNVFHPRFAEFCDARAEEICAPNRDNPWLIGYFLDNELKWWGKTAKHAYGLFEDTMEKPAIHSAKIALVNWLKERYSSIEKFNRSWGAEVESFESILDMTELTGNRTENVERDKMDFVRVIVDRYFQIGTEAIRRHDPNHMVLGCRFAGLNNPAYVPAWEAAGKYCDIVTTNVYEKVDLDTGETYTIYKGRRMPLRERFETVNKITGGAPFWVTEWSFPAYDSGLPCKHGAGQRVDTQAERTFAFETYQKGLFSLPFMVGSSFFMWVDEPALGISEWFPEDSNYGLINEDGEPYELLTNACRKLNPRVYQIHAGLTTEVEVSVARKAGRFTVKNRGRQTAECTVRVWTDGVMEETTMLVPARRSCDVEAVAAVLAVPGGHFVRCRVEVKCPGVEVDISNNEAEASLYTPGVPVPASLAEGAVMPLVFSNASDSPSLPAPMVLSADDFPDKVDLESASRRVRVISLDKGKLEMVPSQVDVFPEGAELALRVPSIEPWSAKTLFVCMGDIPAAVSPAVSYHKTGSGFEVSNGRLKLVKAEEGGNLFDHILLDGMELGRYYPMMHQALPQNMWTAPESLEKLEISNGPVRLVLTATLSKSGEQGEVKTTVGEDGTFAEVSQSPATYRTQCRVCIYPDQPWFSSQGLTVENTDTRPWTLVNYFHYMPSAIAGDPANDEASRDHWYDPDAKLAFGACDPAKKIQIRFWLDNGGGQHPDARRAVNVELLPGQVHQEPEATLYIGGAKGDDSVAWKGLQDGISTLNSISCTPFSAP